MPTNPSRIKIIKTEPNVSVEKRSVSVLGSHTKSVPKNLGKYSEILSYHPNPWSINGISETDVIHHFIIDNTNIDEFIQSSGNHIKNMRDIFTLQNLIPRIIEVTKGAKINIIPLETLQNAMKHYFASTIDKPITKVKTHEFVYPLSMTFLRTNVYHFDTTPEFTYTPPEQSVIFGNIKSYHQHDNIEEFNKHFAPVFLIQQYYVPNTTVRRKEINYCLKKNVSSKLFDKIILLNEKVYDKYDCNVMDDPVIQQVVIKKRLTYFDVMKFAKENLPKYSYIVLSNSDIYFNNTIHSMFKIDMTKTFMALLRFDLKGDLFDKEFQNIHIFGPRNDSQDTWIWQNTPDIFIDPNSNFPLGKRGCDNAITSIFLKHKYRVINPALSIQTIHVHMSEQRTYSKTEIVQYPFYVLVKPHNIQSFNHITDMSEYTVHTGKTSTEYNIKYPHYSQEIKTFMHYAKKKHGKAPDFNKSLTIQPYQYQKINSFSNVFLNNEGLVYDRDNIYHYSNTNTNMNETVEIITNTFIHKEAINFIIPDKLNLTSFLTNIYPKLLMLSKSSLNKLPFIIKFNPEFKDYIDPLSNIIKIIPAKNKFTHFAHRLFCPELVPELSWPKEYSKIIHTHLGTQKLPEEYMNVLLIRDPEFYDNDESWKEFTDNIKRHFGEHYNYNEVTSNPDNYYSSVSLFREASIVIGHRCDIMGNIVFCPENSHIIEISYESTPDLNLWNICGASNFNYTLISYKREPKPRQQFMINKKLKQALDNNPFPINKLELIDFKEFKSSLLNEAANITSHMDEKPITFKINDEYYEILQDYIHLWNKIYHEYNITTIIDDVSGCLVNDKEIDLQLYPKCVDDFTEIYNNTIPLEHRNTLYYDSTTKFNRDAVFVHIYTPQQLLKCIANGSIPVLSNSKEKELMQHSLFSDTNIAYFTITYDENENEDTDDIIKDAIDIPDKYKNTISHNLRTLWKQEYSPISIWNKIMNNI
jgi:hypothetical protein